jgi:putative PEP-CTERM system TPR-repeat lipoprotein
MTSRTGPRCSSGRARRVPLWAVALATALAVSACSKDPEVAAREYVASGDRYLAEQKTSEAIIQYKNAVKERPQWAEPHFKLAQAHEKAGDPVNAYREYARAADIDPSNVDAQIKAGTLLLVAREFDAARTRAELALKANPNHAPAHILLGNAMAGLNETGAALKQIEQAITLDPSYAPAWTALGAVKFLGGRRGDAGEAFRKAVALSPASLDAHLALANYEWASGNTADAEKTLRGALALERDSASVHRALALLFLSTRRPLEAEPHFKALSDREPGGRLALADYYMGIGRHSNALEVLTALASSSDQDDSRAARLRIAALNYASGKKEEAHRAIDALLQEKPRYVEARIAKARMLLSDGAPPADAAAHAREAVKTDPSVPGAHYAAGLAALAGNKLDEAEKAFHEVARLAPRAAAAQLQLARIQLARGEPALAMTAAKEAAEKRPDDPEAAVLLTRSLRAQGDVTRAWREISTRAAKQPDSAPLQIEMGWTALDQRHYAVARKAFEDGLRLDPSSYDARNGLVVADVAERQFDRARARVKDWRQAAPADPRLQLLDARLELAAGNAPDAERRLTEIIAADPSQLEAYELLGRAYVASGRTDAAIAQFETLATKASSPAPARTLVAMLHDARGDRAKARSTYEAVMSADPRAGVAANNLAWIYAEDGRFDDALRLAKVAQEELRKRPEAEDTLGWIYLRKGQPVDAMAAFQRASDRAPRNPVYHYHLGLAFLDLGDTKRGRQSLERALALDDKFEGASVARAKLAETSRPGRS